jgi:hypothetical protein
MTDFAIIGTSDDRDSSNAGCAIFTNFAKMKMLDSEYFICHPIVADLAQMEEMDRAFRF